MVQALGGIGAFGFLGNFFNNLANPVREMTLYFLEAIVAFFGQTAAAVDGTAPGLVNLATFRQDVRDVIEGGPVQAVGSGILAALMSYELVNLLSRSNTLSDVDVGTYVRWILKCVIAFFFFNNAGAISGALMSVGYAGFGMAGGPTFAGGVDEVVNAVGTLARWVGGIIVAWGAVQIGLGVGQDSPVDINRGLMTAFGGALLFGASTVLGQFFQGGAGTVVDTGAIGAPAVPPGFTDGFSDALDEMNLVVVAVVFLMVAAFAVVAVVMQFAVLFAIVVVSVEAAVSIALAPIPLATMGSEEFGEIGRNYLKKTLALGLRFVVIAVMLRVSPIFIGMFLDGVAGADGFFGILGALVGMLVGGLVFVKMLFESKNIANGLLGVA